MFTLIKIKWYLGEEDLVQEEHLEGEERLEDEGL